MNSAMEKIVTARIAMLMKFAFWGNLATRLLLKEEKDGWCKTAATDGRNLYFDSEFINGLTDRQTVFVVGHELLHVVFEHVGISGRCVGHDKMLSNIAADYVVNDTLIQEKLGDHIGEFISKDKLLDMTKDSKTMGTLYDPKYKNWSYEQVYEDLINDPRVEKFSAQGIAIGFDQHPDGSGENGEPEISETELSALKDEIREAILSAAQTVGIGNVPGNIKRLIGELTEPKMDWRELLNAFIESQVKSDYSYMKLGRRSFSSDIVFPSMKREPKIQVTLALDMSGSIGAQEIKEFFSEVKGIVEQHASYEIGVCCWDTRVYNYQSFTEDDGDKIMEYEPQGGGGTDLSCVFEYFKENDIEPKQLVVFTDGEIYNWGDPDYCDTLFIIKNNYNKNIEAPFGETVAYA